MQHLWVLSPEVVQFRGQGHTQYKMETIVLISCGDFTTLLRLCFRNIINIIATQVV